MNFTKNIGMLLLAVYLIVVGIIGAVIAGWLLPQLFTAPLVAVRVPAELLVFVAGMIPATGEAPDDWPANTGFDQVMRQQAQRYAGQDLIYQDVPPALAAQARRNARDQSDTPGHAPWPLDAWPPVPTRFVLCTEDRFFPPEFMRRVVADRLGVVPDEISAGHAVALSRPKELAGLLASYTAPSR